MQSIHRSHLHHARARAGRRTALPSDPPCMIQTTSSCSARLPFSIMPSRDQPKPMLTLLAYIDPTALIPATHVQPLETRAAGASLNTASNMLFTFLIGQVFISMLCSMKWGVFLLFTGVLGFRV